ncbi:uncharacterized protein LOC144345911 [Saccoglossus kowalevskii]
MFRNKNGKFVTRGVFEREIVRLDGSYKRVTSGETVYDPNDDHSSHSRAAEPSDDVPVVIDIQHQEEVMTSPGKANYLDDDCVAVEHSVQLSDLKVGRRVVDLGVLARDLDACKQCSAPLRLSSCVGDKCYGLGCVLYVRCDNSACLLINRVYTGSRHRQEGKTTGLPVWDINSKLAIGMLHAGIGERQLNNFLSTLNVPGIHHKSLKSREREVGAAIEKIANASVLQSLEDEKRPQ